jgi:hypothetical protein
LQFIWLWWVHNLLKFGNERYYHKKKANKRHSYSNFRKLGNCFRELLVKLNSTLTTLNLQVICEPYFLITLFFIIWTFIFKWIAIEIWDSFWNLLNISFWCCDSLLIIIWIMKNLFFFNFFFFSLSLLYGSKIFFYSTFELRRQNFFNF